MKDRTLWFAVRFGLYLVASAAISWVVAFQIMGVPRTISEQNPPANEPVSVYGPSLETIVPVVAMVIVTGLFVGWRSARDSQ